MTIYHVPENQIMLDEIYLVLSSDKNGEGICAFISPIGNMPMVFGNPKLIDHTIELCKKISEESGKELKLYKFKKSELIVKIDERN